MAKYSVEYKANVPVGGVRLTGGRLKQSFDNNIAFLKGFDLDRMLYWYRVHAGKPAPGVPYATDEGHFENNLKGQTAGQFMMGAGTALLWQEDEELRKKLYQKIIDTVSFDDHYLILLGSETYDVPFKSKDDSFQKETGEESYTFLICAVCPVKQTKPNLHYVAEEKLFHDGAINQMVSAPQLGFLFPAFDNRSTNIYNSLMYSKDIKEGHEAFIEAIFNTDAPKPAAEQKKSFEALLSTTLQEDCSMDLVQTVHDEICQRIEMHKEAKVADPLMISKEEVKSVLSQCGVSEEHVAKFSVEYDEVFGFDADLHPKNIIDNKKFEIKTPDVSIKVAPDRADLIETRVIGGVKYILICADEDVEVNGVSIHIGEKEPAAV